MASNRPSKQSAQTNLTQRLDSHVLLPSSRQTGSKNRTKTSAKSPVLFTDVIEISSDEDEVATPPPPKRKERSTPIVDVAHLERELKRLQQENASLVRKHAESQQELDSHRNEKNSMSLDVAELEDHITCEICALKLWIPCILPDCGHTFCQSCLQDWFSTTLAQHMQTYPHFDVNQNPVDIQHMINLTAPVLHQLLPPPPKYTCPTCRAQVKSRPIESFSLKAVVRAVAKVQRESSPRKPLQSRGNGRGTSTNNDPWDGFFPRA